MSVEFFTYALIFLICIGLSVSIIGWKRVRSTNRLIGVFLATFTLTYLIRPAATDILQDDSIYLRFNALPFRHAPWSITFAVFLALLSLAIGYRLISGATKPENIKTYK